MPGHVRHQEAPTQHALSKNDADQSGLKLIQKVHHLRCGGRCAAGLYLRRVCTADKAVDHLHGIVDVLKLHECLVLDCASIQPDADYSAKRLAQLHDFLLGRIRWQVADV